MLSPLFALIVVSPGCRPDSPAGLVLDVRARSLDACPVSERALIELEALGDFEASNRTAESVRADASQHELSFPLSTRAVKAEASDGSERWLGVANVHGDAAELALLPEARDCALFRAEAGGYPSRSNGQSLALSADGRFLLVAGGNDVDAAETLLFELGTSRHATGGLLDLRANATATPFGSGFLVAGGQRPDGTVLSDADFVQASLTPGRPIRIDLGEIARARHAATVLPSGETLLLGGHGGGEQRTPLTSLEAISPETLEFRLHRLAALAVGRIEPTAITLSDGRILVGGGTDALGDPVTVIEWLTPDAARPARAPLDLAGFGAAGVHLGFAALPGGAALAADDGLTTSGARPPQAYWISPEGLVETISLPAPAPDPSRQPAAPLLIPASNGSPFLLLGTPAAPDILRFNPWAASAAERFEPAGIVIVAPLPGPGMPKPVPLDPGAFAWLAPESDQLALFGLRHDTRGAYARDVSLVNRADPDHPARPLHLAPDFRPGPESLSYDGMLRLGADGTAPAERIASAFVTDTVYAELDLTIDLQSGPPPLLLIGGIELGGPVCAWPEAGAAPEQLRLLRRGSGALLIRGNLQRACEVPEGRLAIGLKQGGLEASVVTRLAIRRQIQLE